MVNFIPVNVKTKINNENCYILKFDYEIQKQIIFKIIRCFLTKENGNKIKDIEDLYNIEFSCNTLNNKKLNENFVEIIPLLILTYSNYQLRKYFVEENFNFRNGITIFKHHLHQFNLNLSEDKKMKLYYKTLIHKSPYKGYKKLILYKIIKNVYKNNISLIVNFE